MSGPEVIDGMDRAGNNVCVVFVWQFLVMSLMNLDLEKSGGFTEAACQAGRGMIDLVRRRLVTSCL